MIDVDNEQAIIISRLDSATIPLSIPLTETTNYEFEIGDIITLRIYEKNGYDKAPVFEKNITVDSATESVNIALDEHDTEFAEISNKPVTYWYEIVLNNEKTVIGYEKDSGAKKFIVTPSKKIGGGH